MGAYLVKFVEEISSTLKRMNPTYQLTYCLNFFCMMLVQNSSEKVNLNLNVLYNLLS